jgi:hypothetical protein
MQDLRKETKHILELNVQDKKMATGKGRMASGFYSVIS